MALIYTVTFNPSLDYIIRVDDFRIGEVNRTSYEKILPGGKGINVSIVLKNLGHESTALGFAAGFTGREIERRLAEYGVKPDFISLEEGFSRINVKMKSKEESEINGQGPKITEAAIAALFEKLDAMTGDDILVISGSIPNTLPSDMYERILARYQEKKIPVVVDATRDLLTKVLKFHPFLIKPNNHELGEIFGVELRTREEVIPYAKKLQEMGARNVLISMAGEGAVFISEKGDELRSEAPKGKVVNSVGAGDSMVAGFLAGYLEASGDYRTAFRMGLSAGSSSAFSEELATRKEVEELLKTF
ncbi:1-phosphofructokinase [[Clostridium] aminophilum]|uniref:Tagatose-6-phosphate kinase n=1 Tax=[Clostridium] aminophilum TaxID=1526 RepID=A0A1I0D1I9_9FIRM|nr:1-phosphofructokinase [[Clostridium] aminophilum]SET25297.1 1-phosphofructokinase [[Clostridium] aminophilum]